MNDLNKELLLKQDLKSRDLTKALVSVKSFDEIKKVLSLSPKELESFFNTKIRNGQHVKGMREALTWVIS